MKWYSKVLLVLFLVLLIAGWFRFFWVFGELMARSGDQFTLHYKEYLGALPWRGHSVYVVDSIISSEKVEH